MYDHEWSVVAAYYGIAQEDRETWLWAVRDTLYSLDGVLAIAAAPMVLEWYSDPKNLGTSPFKPVDTEAVVLKKKREQRSEDYGWQGLD